MNRHLDRRVAPAVASILAVLALGLAACGDDDDSTTATTSAEAGAVATTAPEDTGDDGSSTTVDGSGASTTPPSTNDDDGETFEVDAYVDAVVEEIGVDDTDTASCVARAVVDAIGVERIETSGVSPDDFADAPSLDDIGLAIDEAAAPAMQADLESCGDLVELFASADDVTDVQRECARETLTTELVAELFVSQFVGLAPSAELTAASEAVQACAAD